MLNLADFMKNKLNLFFNNPRTLYGISIITLIIGVWVGLPFKNLYGDEFIFVGPVFKNLASFQILPKQGDFQYGLISYYFSFFIDGVISTFLLLKFGLDREILKTFLIENSHYFYLVPRFVNIFAFAIFFRFLILKVPKTWSLSNSLIFTACFFNPIFLVFSQSGKVWPLNAIFMTMGLYFFNKTLEIRSPENEDDIVLTKKNILFTCLFVALAYINHFLFAFSFILMIFLFIEYPSLRKYIFKTTLGVGLLASAFHLINIEGIKFLISEAGKYNHITKESSVEATDYFLNLLVYPGKILLFFFPILILFFSKTNFSFKDKKFLYTVGFAITYLAIFMTICNYAELYTYNRYVFPLLFIFYFILNALSPTLSKWHLGVVIISLVFSIKTLFLMSGNQTYHEARNYIQSNFNQEETIVLNTLSLFQSEKNYKSHLLIRPDKCSHYCQQVLKDKKSGADHLKFTLLDIEYFDKTKSIPEFKNYYIVLEERLNHPNDLKNLTPLYRVGANDKPNESYELEHFKGHFFDFNFLSIKHFGKGMKIISVNRDDFLSYIKDYKL